MKKMDEFVLSVATRLNNLERNSAEAILERLRAIFPKNLPWFHFKLNAGNKERAIMLKTTVTPEREGGDAMKLDGFIELQESTEETVLVKLNDIVAISTLRQEGASERARIMLHCGQWFGLTQSAETVAAKIREATPKAPEEATTIDDQIALVLRENGVETELHAIKTSVLPAAGMFELGCGEATFVVAGQARTVSFCLHGTCTIGGHR